MTTPVTELGFEARINTAKGDCLFTIKSSAQTSGCLVKGLAATSLSLSLIIGNPPPVQAQVGIALAGLTLGAVFSKLLGNVNSTIQGAIGGALALEVQAGGQIAGVIQQAQVAYAADLNLTYDKLSAAEKHTVDDLSSITDEFTRNAAATANNVMQRTQQIANTLPLAGLFPQLTSYSPIYVRPRSLATDPATVSVVVKGNFADVYRNNFEATASVGGHSYRNVEKTTQTISFAVALADLRQPTDSSLGSTRIDVNIPYQTSSLIGSDNKQLAKFSIVLTTLPKQLGVYSFSTTTTVPATIKREFTTREIQQESGDDDIKCGGEHGDLAMHTVLADPGWTVIPSTVLPVIIWSQGKQGPDKDWWIANNCSTQTTACMCVSTEHHRLGTSGKVHFVMKYTAQQGSTRTKTSMLSQPLPWGARTNLNLGNASNWGLSIKYFDGRAVGISGPYSDEFLHVTTSGANVNLQSFPFN